MANIILSSFYGVNLLENTDVIQGVSLQFHITAKCDQKCKHCYMFDSPNYQNQLDNVLSKEEMFQLVNEYVAFLRGFFCKGHIAITGGDPILSPNFWDILKHINDNYSSECEVSILGNPYHINIISAKKMKELGVKYYQISLDGLMETHDYFRKPGSFNDSLRALEILHNEGIKTLVSFTVSKLNASDLLPLYDFLQNLDYIDSFGFDRLIPTGNAINLKDSIFSAKEYRDFLFKIWIHMISSEKRLIISMKEQMWRLLLFELGLIDPLIDAKNKKCVSGCMCGTGTISVLADGTFYPCRRMELCAGKFPENNFKEIFKYNNVTQKLRQYEKYSGCSSCQLFKFCRGCPAMKYAINRDIYSKEPYCWR